MVNQFQSLSQRASNIAKYVLSLSQERKIDIDNQGQPLVPKIEPANGDSNSLYVSVVQGGEIRGFVMQSRRARTPKFSQLRDDYERRDEAPQKIQPPKDRTERARTVESYFVDITRSLINGD